jgi:hypothetical protein
MILDDVADGELCTLLKVATPETASAWLRGHAGRILAGLQRSTPLIAAHCCATFQQVTGHMAWWCACRSLRIRRSSGQARPSTHEDGVTK